MAGDGQVTFAGNVILKGTAKKVRKLYRGEVIAGFAGSVADAFTLFEKFEGKLEEFHGNLQRAAVELAKEWRTDRMMRNLEALLLVMNKNHLLLLSGNGEVIESDDGIMSIGSGGNYALAAGRALVRHSPLEARQIAEEAMKVAADLCVFTNHNFVIEELD